MVFQLDLAKKYYRRYCHLLIQNQYLILNRQIIQEENKVFAQNNDDLKVDPVKKCVKSRYAMFSIFCRHVPFFYWCPPSTLNKKNRRATTTRPTPTTLLFNFKLDHLSKEKYSISRSFHTIIPLHLWVFSQPTHSLSI